MIAGNEHIGTVEPEEGIDMYIFAISARVNARNYFSVAILVETDAVRWAVVVVSSCEECSKKY